MVQNENGATMNFTSESQENIRKYIIFRVFNEFLALKLSYVQEVLDIEKLRSIPLIDEKISGMYNLRNELLPIINFRKILFDNLSEELNILPDKSKRVIVLKSDKDFFGLEVDEINDILDFEDSHFKNIPSAIETKIAVEYIDKIALINNNLVKILDLGEIIKSEFDITFLPEITMTEKKSSEGSSLILDDKQEDAFKEIANIASGHAMSALSKLFKQKIKINMVVDNLILRKVGDFDNLDLKLDEIVLGIRAPLRNDILGVIYIVFPIDQFVILLNNIDNINKLPKSINSLDDLDDSVQSAVNEIGNIIISQYCDGISDFLKIKVYHEVPQQAIDIYGAMLDSEIANIAKYSDTAIILQTQISLQNKNINGQIFFIPYYDSVDKFMEYLDAEKIYQLMEKGHKKVKSNNNLNLLDSPNDVFSRVSYQENFSLSKTDMKNMKINDEDLDAFRELGNIGAGNAGNALSQMLNKKVYLEIPPAKVMSIKELRKTYGTNEVSLGYIGTTKGFFESNILLCMSNLNISGILKIIMETNKEKSINKMADLSSSEKSAVIELLNILMGHYISSIGDFLKTMIDPPEYQFFFKTMAELLNGLKIPVEDDEVKAIVIETGINVENEKPIKGLFMLLLHPTIVHKVLKRISEIW